MNSGYYDCDESDYLSESDCSYDGDSCSESDESLDDEVPESDSESAEYFFSDPSSIDLQCDESLAESDDDPIIPKTK